MDDEETFNGIMTKFIEVPSGFSIGDKIRYLNLFLNDMQRNGFNVLSVSDLMRQPVDDDLVEEGFMVEYREVR